MKQGSYRFTLEVGVVIRGSVRRIIREAAHLYGVELDLQEEKGWLESVFMVRVAGDIDQLGRFHETFRATFGHLQEIEPWSDIIRAAREERIQETAETIHAHKLVDDFVEKARRLKESRT